MDGPALARKLAARSAVLLRNDGVLPVPPATTIALIGGLARDARVLGGGSAQVYPEHVVSPLEGLRAAGARVTYARGADPSVRFQPARDGFALSAIVRDVGGDVLTELPLPDGVIMWMGQLPDGLDAARVHSVEITGTFTALAPGSDSFGVEGAGTYRLTVDGVTLFDGDIPLADTSDPVGGIFLPPQREHAVDLAADRRVTVSLLHSAPPLLGAEVFPAVVFALRPRRAEAAGDPEALLAQAVSAAAAGDVAVVVVGTTNEVETEGFDRSSLRLPGRQDELVARVVAANPRTVVVVNAGAPVEMPWRNEVAAMLLTWFPGQEGGHALADVLLGDAEPGGRLPTTWPMRSGDCPVTAVTPEGGTLPYEEGILIGYRGWERSARTPAFAFGSGCGYTSWAYEEARRDGDRVTVRLRNTGDWAGREVVQVYLRPGGRGRRPAQALAGRLRGGRGGSRRDGRGSDRDSPGGHRRAGPIRAGADPRRPGDRGVALPGRHPARDRVDPGVNGCGPRPTGRGPHPLAYPLVEVKAKESPEETVWIA